MVAGLLEFPGRVGEEASGGVRDGVWWRLHEVGGHSVKAKGLEDLKLFLRMMHAGWSVGCFNRGLTDGKKSLKL